MEGIAPEDVELQRVFEMRYRNQIKECEVTMPAVEITEKWLGELREAFDRRHEELYTYAEPDTPVDVINIESVAYGAVTPPDISGGLPTDGTVADARIGSRDAYGRRPRMAGAPRRRGRLRTDRRGLNGADRLTARRFRRHRERS